MSHFKRRLRYATSPLSPAAGRRTKETQKTGRNGPADAIGAPAAGAAPAHAAGPGPAEAPHRRIRSNAERGGPAPAAPWAPGVGRGAPPSGAYIEHRNADAAAGPDADESAQPGAPQPWPARPNSTDTRSDMLRFARLTPPGHEIGMEQRAGPLAPGPAVPPPPETPDREPAPAVAAPVRADAGSGKAVATVSDAAGAAGGPTAATLHVPANQRLFASDAPLPDTTVAKLVASAEAQAANPRWDGTRGRRPVGPGLWLAWDDAANAPLRSEDGGVLIIAAEAVDDRIGIARDSAGGLVAWDMEANAPWPDAQGNPIALPAGLVTAHAAQAPDDETGDAVAVRGFSPLELAQALAFVHELCALAEADEQSLPGRLAGLDALIEEIGDSRHPLFDQLGPYLQAIDEMIPYVAGAARWSRATERRAAFQILDQTLRLLRIGLDDPARLADIVDPARERSAGDPTRHTDDPSDRDATRQPEQMPGDNHADIRGDQDIEPEDRPGRPSATPAPWSETAQAPAADDELAEHRQSGNVDDSAIQQPLPVQLAESGAFATDAYSSASPQPGSPVQLAQHSPSDGQPDGPPGAAGGTPTLTRGGWLTPEIIRRRQVVAPNFITGVVDGEYRAPFIPQDGASSIELWDEELGFVELPKPPILHPEYDWTAGLFHVYEHIDVVIRGPVDADKLWEAFRMHPAPGDFVGQEKLVETDSRIFVDVEEFGIRVSGHVTHTLHEAERTVINTTEPDHTVHEGSVQRTLIITPEGAFIYTAGAGVNDTAWHHFLNRSPVGVGRTWSALNEQVGATYRELIK